jgi:hypothetical protein
MIESGKHVPRHIHPRLTLPQQPKPIPHAFLRAQRRGTHCTTGGVGPDCLRLGLG